MGQEIGNELDEQNGKDKLLPHFYVRLGLIFFSPHTTALPAHRASSWHERFMFRQPLQILPIHHLILLCLTPFPVGCVHLGCFPKPDFWTKRLLIAGPKHKVNFVLGLLHFSVLWQFLCGAGLHLSVLILCLSWWTEWKSLEPAIRGETLHCLLQMIGFGGAHGSGCRSD